MVHQAESAAKRDKLMAAYYGNRSSASRNCTSRSRRSNSDCNRDLEEVMGSANERRSSCLNYVNLR